MIGSETDVSIFSISGVDYYKSSYKYNIAELLEQNYDYIVLDLGDHHSSHYLEEFYRAHVQLVIGHGASGDNTGCSNLLKSMAIEIRPTGFIASHTWRKL